VRRRRLAAELRRLRETHSGKPTGSVVARALGWSPAKISRYELGQGGFPPEEVGKLLDYFDVPEPRRAQLLSLAADANARGWWEDYADSIAPEYMDFIGLEAEAATAHAWQVETVPGLLQTEEYAHQIQASYQSVVRTPPSIIERRVQVRVIRQGVLTTRIPVLDLAVVVDESALLRKVGSPEIMYTQLLHMTRMTELPNVELRVLPLESDTSLMADSFVVFGFSPEGELGKLGDVACTESLQSELYIEGETDIYAYRLFYEAFAKAALSPEDSRQHILRIAENRWK
jgi:transcriptional regulator with XRE-family HTH domain